MQTSARRLAHKQITCRNGSFGNNYVHVKKISGR